jgi:RteC protein
MNAIYHPLYTELLAELESHAVLAMPEPVKTEYCFRVAVRFWQRARERMDNFPFTNGEEEMLFFKTIKPLFTSRIEFYMLVYPAVLFKPADTKKAPFFWENELLRFTRFMEKQQQFIQYYKSGASCLDHLYFLRVNNPAAAPGSYKVYDRDPAYTSSCDWLVAELLGHEMYQQYVHAQLQAVE